jgi:hypothetical protein
MPRDEWNLQGLKLAAAAGGSTGDKIATWQRMGSVYGKPSNKKKAPQDPYQVSGSASILAVQTK